MSIVNILRQGWYQSFKLLTLDCDASTEFLELLLLFFFCFQCCLGLGFRTLKMDIFATDFSATIYEHLAVPYGS